ncbi:heme exporter protein CcmD [Noviherbaspirillum sp. CPCC 100848]|uniref:Heme exporter protein D n=1 Tax=Noviherbaspirillum album TaxID=3080276 RepID=A0ABU6JK06_9BURK|nr:heme exporter protein CcmD [Noviherbaspirillum sp. CPCC 100848]MEC4723640.1 heme exporter protein CcmD [Noviherbaspirillum sp. CPCC 100848]
MNWDSLSHFIEMGGHGLYVWGSVLVAGGAVIAEVVSLHFRRQAGVRRVDRMSRHTGKFANEK